MDNITLDKNDNKETVIRKNRVKNIKKLILTVAVVLILGSCVLNFVLFMRVMKLERKIIQMKRDISYEQSDINTTDK